MSLVSSSVLADSPLFTSSCVAELDAGILTSRYGGPDGGDLVVGRDDARARGVDSQLGFGLSKGALGTFYGELQFPCVELNQHLSGTDLLTKLDVHAGDGTVHFAAHANLIWRNQTAREIYDALNRDALRRCGLDLDGRGFTTASAASLAAVLVVLLGVVVSFTRMNSEDKNEQGG